MKSLRYDSAILALALILCGGCVPILPTGFMSDLIMSPEVSCQALVTGLQLGTLPDASRPDQIGLTYEDISVVSANGRRIVGWFVPAQWAGELDANPAGTVLVMHGTSGPVACTLPWVAVAAANRMHVVAFDYQGYGDSEGAPDIATLLDDSQAMLDWILSDESTARQNVHLLGISLGTGPALGLAALRSRPEIKSVTLDGPYDPEAMIALAAEPAGILFPLLDFSARLGFAWLFETRARLGDIQTPVMILQAEDDTTTPTSGATALYERIGSPSKSFWLFEGLTHVQPLFHATERTVSLLVTFWRDPGVQPSDSSVPSDASIHLPAWTQG